MFSPQLCWLLHQRAEAPVGSPRGAARARQRGGLHRTWSMGFAAAAAGAGQVCLPANRGSKSEGRDKLGARLQSFRAATPGGPAAACCSRCRRLGRAPRPGLQVCWWWRAGLPLHAPRDARPAPPAQLQQLLFCVAMLLPSPGLMVLAGLFMAGSRAMRFLISAAIVMNACSTLLADLAEVSM